MSSMAPFVLLSLGEFISSLNFCFISSVTFLGSALATGFAGSAFLGSAFLGSALATGSAFLAFLGSVFKTSTSSSPTNSMYVSSKNSWSKSSSFVCSINTCLAISGSFIVTCLPPFSWVVIDTGSLFSL